MISLARPSGDDIARFGASARELTPTYPAPGRFHEFEQEGVVGRGPAAFAGAAAALRDWRMHEGAGVSVVPAPLAAGETVTLHTRTLGLWLLFACRITEIHDAEDRFGFTYATLPGHPEQGQERFVVQRMDNGDVVLRINAVSRPATLLTRLSGPIGRLLQRRYARAYIDAVARHAATQ